MRDSKAGQELDEGKERREGGWGGDEVAHDCAQHHEVGQNSGARSARVIYKQDIPGAIIIALQGPAERPSSDICDELFLQLIMLLWPVGADTSQSLTGSSKHRQKKIRENQA